MAEKEKSCLENASMEHIEALYEALIDVMRDIDRDESTITEIYVDNILFIILLIGTHNKNSMACFSIGLLE